MTTKAESEQWREGYKAGYQLGYADGKATGYVDAKIRAHTAVEAALDGDPRGTSAKVRRALDNVIGKLD